MKTLQKVYRSMDICWVIFHAFVSSADFLQNYFFQKILRVPDCLDPDHRMYILSVLIWIQTVCKDYQQMTKVAASKKRAIMVMKCLKISAKSGKMWVTSHHPPPQANLNY